MRGGTPDGVWWIMMGACSGWYRRQGSIGRCSQTGSLRVLIVAVAAGVGAVGVLVALRGRHGRAPDQRQHAEKRETPIPPN